MHASANAMPPERSDGRTRPIITLTSDFGTFDSYVGAMKGAILSIAPDVTIVDITHGVPAQDVAAGSYHLSNAWHHFPPGTIHVAVVDPGVGSARRALAVSSQGHIFLAPDNGLLDFLFTESAGWESAGRESAGRESAGLAGAAWEEAGGRAYAITDKALMAATLSSTFHGRDLFAPVAARLATGTPLDSVGIPVHDPIRLPKPVPRSDGSELVARIVAIDRFGNAVLDLRVDDIARAGGAWREGAIRLETPSTIVTRIVTHYAESGSSPCALINSDGRIEIAVPGRSAAEALGFERGDRVVVRFLAPPKS